MNKLDDKIKNHRINFSATDLGKLNYRYLMNNTQIEVDPEVVEMYNRICRQYHFRLNVKDGLPANITPVAINILLEFEAAFPEYSIDDVCDMLVKHLYHERKNVANKELLWDLFGQIILDSLLYRVPHGSKMCINCGRRFVPRSHAHKFCAKCARQRKLARDREIQAERRIIAKQALS